MTGLSRTTGLALDATEHLRQSIADILTTPLGSRVMRREYGSNLPFLIDQPFNDHTRQLCYAATAMALMRWEPRLRLTRIAFSLGAEPGRVLVDIEGTPVDSNQAYNLQIPLAMGAAA
ncbi:baseplate assembly protein [Pseudomonas sp. PA15(2017)]|uniref:GPW/gp25 family protein n=1 Tax=Pseudomonas sp. PA15(2017) TaxID=1932111 RepID=UPI00095BE165|nr:GPW/gp25 family protein [Pseudomonas sp. PA15(2017)]OLU22478.1 baseplate assembly protein [Pseudomonas sp. PA15(2017)]